MERWALALVVVIGCRSGAEPASPVPGESAVSAAPAAAEAARRSPSARPEAERVRAKPAPEQPAVAVAPAPAPAAPGPKTKPAPAPRPKTKPAPPTAPPPPAAPVGRAPRRGDEGHAQAKVLILGDSMAATDFGRALERRIDAHARLQAVRRGKSSTGLARPDFFDWMAEAERQLRKHQPDLVVVIIGGNDGQDLIPAGKGRRVHWRKPEWAPAYAARVQSFARLLMGDDRKVAWIELPAMDRRRFEGKLKLIRKVQRDALRELGPRVRYVPTRDIFYDARGRLRRRVEAGQGQVDLRQEDGIHFSLPGSEYFADRVYPTLLAEWSLTP